jgi:uncharacterized membrane protein YjgN (DUF898 family)
MQDTVLPEIAVPAAPAPAPEALQLAFSGSGKEYFRIWIVNLLLSLATLGIYSAWAKVRRLQYFYRNTTLAGAAFDFEGKPSTILKGRLVAAALLALYHYAFGIAVAATVAVAGALVLALPFLARSALRFRLGNTRYRGLAFGFDGGIGGAYLAWLPPLATVLLPGVLVTLARRDRALLAGALGLAVLALYLAWPAMHGAMKRYQHGHLRFGDQGARFTAGIGRFYRPYLGMIGLVLAGLVAMFVLGAATALVTTGAAHAGGLGAGMKAGLVALGVLLFYGALLAVIPYLQARVTNLAWSNTRFPGVAIRSELGARGLLRVHAANTVLTLLTLGLYRPFAVVRLYRYRLAHVTLEVDGGIEAALAATQPRRLGAAGDGAADLFGIDISW